MLLSANLNVSTLLYESPCISRVYIKAKRLHIARMYVGRRGNTATTASHAEGVGFDPRRRYP